MVQIKGLVLWFLGPEFLLSAEGSIRQQKYKMCLTLAKGEVWVQVKVVTLHETNLTPERLQGCLKRSHPFSFFIALFVGLLRPRSLTSPQKNVGRQAFPF